MQYIIIKVDFTLALDNFRHRVWVSCLDHLNYLLPRNVRVWVIDFASRYNDFFYEILKLSQRCGIFFFFNQLAFQS